MTPQAEPAYDPCGPGTTGFCVEKGGGAADQEHVRYLGRVRQALHNSPPTPAHAELVAARRVRRGRGPRAQQQHRAQRRVVVGVNHLFRIQAEYANSFSVICTVWE